MCICGEITTKVVIYIYIYMQLIKYFMIGFYNVSDGIESEGTRDSCEIKKGNQASCHTDGMIILQ